MDEENKKKLEDFKKQQESSGGSTMSQEQTINPEMNEKKQSNQGTSASAEETKTEGEKKESAGQKIAGVFRVTGLKIKAVAVGGYTFAKESMAQAWNAVVEYYQNTKRDIEEKGVLKWFSDGFRKSAYGFLKLSIKVAAFVFVHNLIINATGFSILNPYLLMGLLVMALGLSVYASVKAQKEMGSVNAKTTGRHLVADIVAA